VQRGETGPAQDAERAALREAEALAERLARLQAVTAELAGARTPGEVAEAALTTGRAALGGDSGVVLVQGGVGGSLEVLRVAGVSEAALRRSTAMVHQTPARQAWQSASALFLERPEELAERFPEFMAGALELHRGAIAALPLAAEGRVLGMLVLAFASAHPFPAAERELALAVARLCAQALERAQLFVAERAARAEAVAAQRRLAFLDALSGVLNDTLDEREMCRSVVQLAVPALGDWAAVLADGRGGPPEVEAAAGPEALGQRARALLREDPGRWPAAAVAPPAVLEAAPGDPRAPLAVALVPLGARGQSFGALAIASADPAQRYGPHDLALLSDVARRTALALEHARLFREARADAQAREDCLHVASHELRGPLSTLQLAVQLLARDLARGDQAKVEDRLRLLQRQAHRLDRLSDALLDVSRITSGQLTLVREELDLAALVREVAARHLDEAETAGVPVSVVAPGVVTCLVDPERVEQVLVNLLSNAVKYGRGSPVEVRAWVEEGYALLSVSDHGMGISAENQARVFERFERLAPRSAGGLGLGLWIARGLVEAHGGRIGVVSAPGQGATFTVRLPRGGG
jgi:signal transduction histidine kinase